MERGRSRVNEGGIGVDRVIWDRRLGKGWVRAREDRKDWVKTRWVGTLCGRLGIRVRGCGVRRWKEKEGNVRVEEAQAREGAVEESREGSGACEKGRRKELEDEGGW